MKEKKMYALLAVFVLAVLFPLSATPYASTSAAVEERQHPPGIGKKLHLTTGLMIRKEVEVSADCEQVWQAWSSEKGAVTFFAPQAKIELAVGGEYEMYFAPKQQRGHRGSEGCVILSFIPSEMISFTWNAPPSLAKIRDENTWVVLTFKPMANGKTRVQMVHLGWGAGEEWQKALRYFDRAWELVLSRLVYRFRYGPIDWKNPYTPERLKQTN